MDATEQRILEALKTGPKLNIELKSFSPSMSNHVSHLRTKGYGIECQRVAGTGKNGLFLYTLHGNVEAPRWRIDVEVALADGTKSMQQVDVSAWTARQAKSRARVFAAIAHARKAELLTSVTGREWDTPDEGH